MKLTIGLSQLIINIKAIIITIFVVFLFYPIFAIVVIPVHIYRWFVKRILAPMLRPDLSQMLTARSALLGVDDYMKANKSPAFSLLTRLDLSSKVDIHLLREEITKAWTQNYIETTQYLEYFAGFLFWKTEEKFNIQEHVYTLDTKFNNQEELLEFFEDYTYRPFRYKKSPWEMIKIDQQSWSNGDILILRVHHTLADGYSLLNMSKKLIKDEVSVPTPDYSKYKNKSFCMRMFKSLGLVILGPFQIIKNKLRETRSDIKIWDLKADQLSHRYITAISCQIPISIIKEIKNKNEATFLSVLAAAYAGAVRNYIIKEGLKVPAYISVLTPLPVKNHPEKLRNFVAGGAIQLPTGLTNPIDRLKKIEKELRTLKKSAIPFYVFLLSPILGGLFKWMTKPIVSSSHTHGIMSNFPGNTYSISILGSNIENTFFGGGFGIGTFKLGFSSLTYNGQIVFGCGMDTEICSRREKINNFCNMIVEEIYLLNESNVNLEV